MHPRQTGAASVGARSKAPLSCGGARGAGVLGLEPEWRQATLSEKGPYAWDGCYHVKGQRIAIRSAQRRMRSAQEGWWQGATEKGDNKQTLISPSPLAPLIPSAPFGDERLKTRKPAHSDITLTHARLMSTISPFALSSLTRVSHSCHRDGSPGSCAARTPCQAWRAECSGTAGRGDTFCLRA